jgi:hypothetical protein
LKIGELRRYREAQYKSALHNVLMFIRPDSSDEVPDCALLASVTKPRVDGPLVIGVFMAAATSITLKFHPIAATRKFRRNPTSDDLCYFLARHFSFSVEAIEFPNGMRSHPFNSMCRAIGLFASYSPTRIIRIWFPESGLSLTFCPCFKFAVTGRER